MSVFAHNSSILVSGGTFTAQNFSSSNSEASTLQLFVSNTAIGALHDSAERFDPPKCHPDTRQIIIDRIMNWLDDTEHSSSVMWIYGPAGAGKSAIAQSIADLCFSIHRLAGSFFFGRTSARRNTKTFFIATIAYQMMMIVPEMRERVLRAVETDPAIFSRSLEAQAQALIVKPLNNITQDTIKGPSLISHPAGLLVVDGLDECNLPESQSHILRTLSQLATLLPIWPLKFLITSRPEQAIRSAFRDEPLASVTVSINLDDFSKDVNEDIRVFLNSKFQSISNKHPARNSFPRPWPSEDEMDHLIDRINGQFIYASTVMKYLESTNAHPMQRLTHILEHKVPEGHTPLAALDALYRHILSAVTDDRLGDMLKIMAVVLLAHNNEIKNAKSIDRLLAFQTGTVHIILTDLHSVIHVSDNPIKPLRIYHASFSEFLFDHSRSAEFFVDREVGHIMMARAIMKINFDLSISKLYVHDLIPVFFRYYDNLSLDSSRLKIHDDLYSFDLAKVVSSTDQDAWTMQALSRFVLWLIDKKIPSRSEDLFTFHLKSVVEWVLLDLLRNLFEFEPDTSKGNEEVLSSITSMWSFVRKKELGVVGSDVDTIQSLKTCCISVLNDFFYYSIKKTTGEEYKRGVLNAIQGTLKELLSLAKKQEGSAQKRVKRVITQAYESKKA